MMTEDFEDRDCCDCAYGYKCESCRPERLPMTFRGPVSHHNDNGKYVDPTKSIFNDPPEDILKSNEDIKKSKQARKDQKKIQSRKDKKVNNENREVNKEKELKRRRLERAREILSHPHTDIKPEEGVIPLYLLLKFVHDNRIILERFITFFRDNRANDMDQIFRLEDFQEVFNDMLVKKVQDE